MLAVYMPLLTNHSQEELRAIRGKILTGLNGTIQRGTFIVFRVLVSDKVLPTTSTGWVQSRTLDLNGFKWLSSWVLWEKKRVLANFKES